jgi:hypothetical protein
VRQGYDAEVSTALIVGGITFAVIVCKQRVDGNFDVAISDNVNILVGEVSRLAVACNADMVNGGQYRNWCRGA